MGRRQGSLESVGMNNAFWEGRKVFLTGHTGFKGSWLALWLSRMGAEVHGYALQPPTDPSMFELLGLERELAGHHIADIRNGERLTHALRESSAEIVFHLAAQPLVRASYVRPLETLDVNIMGTAHLLEAVRQAGGVRSVVVVTSDKCYENREWVWPYREIEALGGHDPYSASKAGTEIVASAYRASFFAPEGDCAVATARAGNVIGGGDFAEDRLLPDLFRAHWAQQPIRLRSPAAVRPWQHVLEPLHGYLLLAQRLYEDGPRFAGAWNFGPWERDARNVQWIVEYMAEHLPGFRWTRDENPQPHEAHTLRLDSSKARLQLGWQPAWSLEQALQRTLDWHLAQQDGSVLLPISLEQISEYESAACQG